MFRSEESKANIRHAQNTAQHEMNTVEVVNQIQPKGRVKSFSSDQIAKTRLKQRAWITQSDRDAIDYALDIPISNCPAYASDFDRFSLEPAVEIESRRRKQITKRDQEKISRWRQARIIADRDRIMNRENRVFAKLAALMLKDPLTATSVRYDIVTNEGFPGIHDHLESTRSDYMLRAQHSIDFQNKYD